MACCVALSGATAGAHESPVVNDVLRAWDQRHLQTKVIRYEIDGEWFVPKEALARHAAGIGAPAPDGPITKPVHFEVIVDFEQHRGRIERRAWTIRLDEVRKQVSASASSDVGIWDGDEGKGMVVRAPGDPTHGSPTSPDMIITKDARFKTIDPALRPLFWGHGGITTIHGEVKDPDLFVKYSADIFSVAGTAPLRGMPCTILRTEPRPGAITTHDELWVQPSAGAKLLKRLVVTGKQLTTNEEAEYDQVAGLSLVKSWVRSTFRNGALAQEFRMRVTATDLDYRPKAADFRLEPSPGMHVQKADEVFRVDGTGRMVKVGTDPDMAAYYREHGRTSPPIDDGTETTSQNASRPWIWVVGAGAAFVLVAVLALVVRRVLGRMPARS